MKEALVTVVSLFPPPPSIRFLPFPFRTEIPRCKRREGEMTTEKQKVTNGIVLPPLSPPHDRKMVSDI